MEHRRSLRVHTVIYINSDDLKDIKELAMAEVRAKIETRQAIEEAEAQLED